MARSSPRVTTPWSWRGTTTSPPRRSTASHVIDSTHRTTCPWKGTAHYYSLTVNGETNRDAVWYYPDAEVGRRAGQGSRGVLEGRQGHGLMPAGGVALLVDAAIIGTGQAGPALATALAGRGESVALFEGGLLGGSCVNVGCTPTKTLRKSARVAHLARRAAEFGVRTGEVKVDFAAVMERTADVVRASRTGLTGWIDGTDGVTFVREWAALDGREQDRFVITAGDRRVLASRVYLNTGTRPFLPPIPGLDGAPHLTNETVLPLRERPRAPRGRRRQLHRPRARPGHFAAWAATSPSSRRATRSPRVRMPTSRHASPRCSTTRASRSGPAPAITGRATPRRTAPTGLSLDGKGDGGTHRAARLAPARGHRPAPQHRRARPRHAWACTPTIVASSPWTARSRRTCAGIWALGDINGRGAFTHTSYQDHEIVLANHIGGRRTADGRVTTYAMYTDPPLGRVGMTEREAREAHAGRTALPRRAGTT